MLNHFSASYVINGVTKIKIYPRNAAELECYLSREDNFFKSLINGNYYEKIIFTYNYFLTTFLDVRSCLSQQNLKKTKALNLYHIT
jgi:hypothetical protein